MDDKQEKNDILGEEDIKKNEKQDIEENVEEINLEETNLKEAESKENSEEIEVSEEKDIDEVEDKTISKKGKTRTLLIIFSLLFIVIILLTSTIFAIINVGKDVIFKGVKIQNINISELSKQEAKMLIQTKIDESLGQNINLRYKEYETNITPEELEVSFKIEEAIREAYGIGKGKNIFVNNYEILSAAILGKNINIELEINEEKLKEIIDGISKELPNALKENSYSINGDELIVTKGKEGIVIDEVTTQQKIKEEILKLLSDNKEREINIDVKSAKPEKIDIEQIHSEIYKEAKDAYFTKNPFEIHPHIEGVDFNISMEEAKQILEEEKEEYKIPLKITIPQITTKQLGVEAFPDTLSKFTTSYSGGTKNRATNIAIAARTINGVVLLPGETFSYNNVIGDTTPSKGYKIGTAYASGKIVEAYGGGICQVSSTLYNAVLYANLEIVLRYNHSYPVGYVKPGRDATVSYGGKDFKFKNSRNYPIKIVATAKNGVLTVQIIGVKEEKEYDVELKSSVIQTTPYKITYQNNSSLEKGKQKVIQNGMNGYKSVTYKIVKYNGQIVSNTLLSSDTYSAMNKIIEVGTKESVKTTTNENNKENNSTNNNTTVTTNQNTVTTNNIQTNNNILNSAA